MFKLLKLWYLLTRNEKPTVAALYWKGTSLRLLADTQTLGTDMCYIKWHSVCLEFVHVLPHAVTHHLMMFLSVMDYIYNYTDP